MKSCLFLLTIAMTCSALANPWVDDEPATVQPAEKSVEKPVAKPVSKPAKKHKPKAVAAAPVSVAPQLAAAPAPVDASPAPEAVTPVAVTVAPAPTPVEAPSAAPDRAPASSTDEMKVAPNPLELPNATHETPKGTALVVPGTLKFSAFADLRYSVFTADHDPAVVNANAESGFGLEDGAFAVTYDQDEISLTADIAVRRFKDSDFGLTSNSPNQSNTNRLNFGADGSQLYVKYKANSHLAFDLGQFDGIYGVEAADARSRSFSRSALLPSLMLPVVHDGAMVEFENEGITAKALASNPANRGTNGTSGAGDEKTEFGAAIGYSNDVIQTQVGYLTRAMGSASGTGSSTRNLYDVSAGLTLSKWTFGFEVSDVADPSKNTLTPSDSSDSEDDARGYLGLVSYRVTEKDLVGVRLEKIEHDPAALKLDQVTSWGLSVHHRLQTNLDLSAEFIDFQFRDVAGATWENTLFNVGAIVSF